MREQQKSLYDVTLAGPGLSAPETIRVTDSECIELSKRYQITGKRKADGQAAFAEATGALSRLVRKAELTGDAKMATKAARALAELLGDQPFLSGGVRSMARPESTTIGVAPAVSPVPGAGRKDHRR